MANNKSKQAKAEYVRASLALLNRPDFTGDSIL